MWVEKETVEWDSSEDVLALDVVNLSPRVEINEVDTEPDDKPDPRKFTPPLFQYPTGVTGTTEEVFTTQMDSLQKSILKVIHGTAENSTGIKECHDIHEKNLNLLIEANDMYENYFTELDKLRIYLKYSSQWESN